MSWTDERHPRRKSTLLILAAWLILGSLPSASGRLGFLEGVTRALWGAFKATYREPSLRQPRCLEDATACLLPLLAACFISVWIAWLINSLLVCCIGAQLSGARRGLGQTWRPSLSRMMFHTAYVDILLMLRRRGRIRPTLPLTARLQFAWMLRRRQLPRRPRRCDPDPDRDPEALESVRKELPEPASCQTVDIAGKRDTPAGMPWMRPEGRDRRTQSTTRVPREALTGTQAPATQSARMAPPIPLRFCGARSFGTGQARLVSRRTREAALAGDRSGPASSGNPLDDYLLESSEGAEESPGDGDDPFASDGEHGGSGAREGDFHTTAGHGADDDVPTENLSPPSWPSPLTEDSGDGLGHGPQTKD